MIPPLSQSKHSDMACALNYLAKHVDGIESPSSPAAERGTEIHRVVAEYMDGLRITKQQTDYTRFEELSKDTGPEAQEILRTFLESWIFDSQKIYDTELYIGLGADFKVLVAQRVGKELNEAKRRLREESDKFDPDVESRGPIVFEGTLDMVVMESLKEATIYDWKSYWAIVTADSFQSKLYPFLLMKFNPGIETVRFVLAFVRYGDATREVTYTRADMPRLEKLVERERKRQMVLHQGPRREDLDASPGRHCNWCPLLLNGCPIQNVNPNAIMPIASRVALGVWLAAAIKQNNEILKGFVSEGGPVTYRDANGTGYEANFGRVDKQFYPADLAIPILQAWDTAHKDSLLHKSTISGLGNFLKAQKRSSLAETMNRIAETRTETRFKIKNAEDADDDK